MSVKTEKWVRVLIVLSIAAILSIGAVGATNAISRHTTTNTALDWSDLGFARAAQPQSGNKEAVQKWIIHLLPYWETIKGDNDDLGIALGAYDSYGAEDACTAYRSDVESMMAELPSGDDHLDDLFRDYGNDATTMTRTCMVDDWSGATSAMRYATQDVRAITRYEQSQGYL